ncbi:MAG: PIN domain-containing protein [Candidatus Sulfotelmatobacter sp.]
MKACCSERAHAGRNSKRYCWIAAEPTADTFGVLVGIGATRPVRGEILVIDSAVADRWGLLAAETKRKGSSLSAVDGLLAATALQHNLTIVSRNVADFANTAVTILNPCKA